MTPIEWISALFLAAGAFFFLAGTIGLLRFRDTHSRLHALTKADNLGLGLVVVGVGIEAGAVALAIKLLLIWLLVLLASTTACQMIAQLVHAHPEMEEEPRG